MEQETPQEWAAGFESFWAEYPRRVNKMAAKKAYMRLTPRTQETYDLLFAGLELHHKIEWNKPDPMYPHASTWLNQRRYEDARTTPAA